MDCLVKQGQREIKTIHMEMLDDMFTDAFISGLRCFIAIKEAVRQLRSDQGTNFIGAQNEFQKAVDKERICSFLAEKQCEYVFNAPSA